MQLLSAVVRHMTRGMAAVTMGAKTRTPAEAWGSTSGEVPPFGIYPVAKCFRAQTFLLSTGLTRRPSDEVPVDLGYLALLLAPFDMLCFALSYS